MKLALVTLQGGIKGEFSVSESCDCWRDSRGVRVNRVNQDGLWSVLQEDQEHGRLTGVREHGEELPH